MIQSYKDLKVYQLAFAAAIDIFRASKSFPKEELYSLTDQVRRSSRSVAANLVEGWAKRCYENIFRRHLVDAIGSTDETKLWLDFATECGYLTLEQHRCLQNRYNEIGMMLHGLYDRWHTLPKAEQTESLEEGERE
ncbi:four helix bundle protein [bacterium]|nr:MAG: four helix bundle protein [bacterium]